jgi:YopX protein
MSREIKFRGLARETKKWVYGLPTYGSGGAIDGIAGWMGEDGGEQYEEVKVLEETVSEWTGLKDVFEGDILRGVRKNQADKEGINALLITSTVEFSNGGFKVFSKNMQDGYTKNNNELYQFMWVETGRLSHTDQYYQIDSIKVIGNIYENKYLSK